MPDSVYPVTTELRNAVAEMLKGQMPLSKELEKTVNIIFETVGEYEHGTAETEDVCEQEPISLRQYSAVALDLILCIVNHIE